METGGSSKNRKRVILAFWVVLILFFAIYTTPLPSVLTQIFGISEMVTVYENTRSSGSQRIYYGLIPSLKARYIVYLEWIVTGVTRGVGGIEL